MPAAPDTTTPETPTTAPTQQTLPVTPLVDDPVVRMTPAQMKERLDETRSATEKALLKKLGYESVSAAEKANKAFKDWQDGQLNEQQKLAKQVEEMRPAAERVKVLEERYAAVVARQMASLPESIRKAIEAAAEGPEATARLIDAFEASGAIEMARKAAGPPPIVPPGATTAPPAGAPRSTAPRTKWDEFQERLASGSQIAADIFYQTNRHEIERSRPADQ